MIKIYKAANGKFESIENIETNCWVNVSNPDIEELRKLSTNLSIPLDFLTDSLDIDERSRIELENDCILVVFRAPVFDKDAVDVPFTTIPVGIILKENIKVTVCKRDTEVVLDLCSGKIKHFTTENRNQFVLHLLHRASSFYLKYLEEIDARTNAVETKLQKSTKNEEVIKLLNIEKSLVFFTTSLKSNELMMQRLPKIRSLNLTEDDLDFLEDADIDHKQAIDMAEIYSNILSSMMDAFASVISNNLNIVMKFLTATTLIVMIPTFVASVYGMNIALPLQHSPHAFLITMGISLVLSLASVMLFLKKHWF